MSSRMLGHSLLAVLVAAVVFPRFAPSQQAQENQDNYAGVKWEYKVLKLDGTACTFDNEVANSLNSLGQKGWELVSYERQAPAFPKDADGTLIIRPAATGPSVGVNPPTADSFRGNLSIKMGQVPSSGCRMLLMREWHPQQPPR